MRSPTACTACRATWLAIFAAFAVASCSSARQEEPTTESAANGTGGNVEWIEVDKIQPGPTVHETLTDEQMAHIKALQKVFFEVDGQPVEQWVDNFKRDLNPDRELAIWERMATAYGDYCASREDLTIDVKKEVYKIVLLRSMAPPDEVLSRIELKHLSKDEAQDIMRGYPR